MIRKILSVIIALFLSVSAGIAADTEPEFPALSLYAVNVRKADALLLRCGESAYLIDTGTEDSVRFLLNVLEEEGVTRLDGIILTHTHKDHAGGLQWILESGIEIGHVYASAYYNMKEKKHPAVKALKGTGRDVEWLRSGDSLPLDGGTLEVLGPRVQNEDAENCNSLVLLASGGGGTMLLTGDMEFPEEDDLISSGLIPHADILKVANHGESDATGEALVKAVSPAAAVISTNTDDEPDTPSGRVMKLLDKYGVIVYQTQETENGVLITLQNGKIGAEYR